MVASRVLADRECGMLAVVVRGTQVAAPRGVDYPADPVAMSLRRAAIPESGMHSPIHRSNPKPRWPTAERAT